MLHWNTSRNTGILSCPAVALVYYL